MKIEFTDEELGDDDVFVLESIANAQESKDDKLQVTIVFTLKDTMMSLARIIRLVEVYISYFNVYRSQKLGELVLK